MQHRNFLLIFSACTASLLIVVAVFNFVVDPLQFYRKAEFYQPSFSMQQRYQNPGLARHYTYDTIIIGTSMTENFVPSHLDKKLGVKTMKLAMSGASAREENMIANVAIRTGQVKNVLWGLDFASLRGSIDRVGDNDGPFPYYLYDDHYYNDFRYLASISILASSLKDLQNLYLQQQPEQADLDYLYNWNSQVTFGREVLMKIWQTDQADRQKGIKEQIYGEIDPSYKAMRASFDHNLEPLIKENPDINFVIYYPPFSILRYRNLYEEDQELFYSELAIKKYIFTRLKTCQNVTIYDFQNDKNLTFNLNKYKDFSHHSQEYNEYIIDALARQDKKYLVTPGSIDLMLQDLKTQVETLQVEKL